MSPGRVCLTREGIEVRWLGRIEYRVCLEAQRAHREALVAGRGTEALWCLEHDPVVTLGRRGGDYDAASLAARGVPVVETERGGLATWHGPGQLVGYLLLDLPKRRWAIRKVVHGMEAGLIDWLARRGVVAGRREGAPGVWTDRGKIAQLGLHVRRGITLHGFALNLDLAPDAFRGIVPCGLEAQVTSLVAEGGEAVVAENVAPTVASTLISSIVAAHR